jgi:two-component system response regulator HydG
VDDEPDMRWLLARVFQRAGWLVRTSGSGAEALSCMEKSKFTAIVIDWRLPDMDGTELTEKIKEIDPSTAVVMISGCDPKDKSIRKAYSEDLIECFLAKPFIHEHVLRSVELAVSRKKGCT